MVYDVGEERVNKVLKIARSYMFWVQNSVLEGELTEASYVKLKSRVKRVIKKEDSVIFYIFDQGYRSKETLGTEKNKPLPIL